MLKTLLFRQKLVSLQLQPFLVLTQSNATVSQQLLEIVTQVSMQKEIMQTENQANNTEEKAKTQTKKFPRPQRSLLAPTGALYIIVCNYLSKTSTVCFSTQRHIVSVITTKASTQQKQIFKQMMQQRNITIMSECTHIPRFPRCVTAIMSSLKVFIIQELLSRLM